MFDHFSILLMKVLILLFNVVIFSQFNKNYSPQVTGHGNGVVGGGCTMIGCGGGNGAGGAANSRNYI